MKITIPLGAILKNYADHHYTAYPMPTDDGRCDEAIEEAVIPEQVEIEINLDAELAKQNQIAVVWSVEDVQENRSDLDDDQAWQVLQAVEDNHDCNFGITWDTLKMTAEQMFPAPIQSARVVS